MRIKKNQRILYRVCAWLLVTCTCALGITACGEDKGAKRSGNKSYETINMILLGNEPSGGMDAIYEEFDKLTKEDLGCIVRFTFVPWGNERKQLNIAAASGEYDILPNGTFSDYKQLIRKNAFVNLSDYLEEVPMLVAHYRLMGDEVLTDCEVDGKLYGIPQLNTEPVLYNGEGFLYRQDLCKAWGLDPVTDLDSMEKYLYRAKQEEAYKDEPLITDNRIWQSLWILLADDKYVEVGSLQETPFVVVDVNNPGKIVCRLETPEFKTILEYIKRWKDDGILESDMLALSDNEGTRGINLMAADKKPCETNVPIWSAKSSAVKTLSELHAEWEYAYFQYITVRKHFYKGSLANASALSVSAKSANPLLALKFIEKLHTDQRYYNLMHYGVEGINYVMSGDFVSYEGIASDNRFCINVAGDVLLDYEEIPANMQFYNDAVSPLDAWGDEHLADAERNPLATFTYSAAGLESEIEALDDIQLQNFRPLVCGYYEDPESELAELVERLYARGLTSYIEKLEAQMNK